MSDELKRTYLSLKDTQQYAGISISTLRKLIAQGHITPLVYPGGGKYYLKRQDVDRLLNPTETHAAAS